jgi:hypothetical protein
MAEGWLCVSTLMHTAWSSSKAITPALSTNTDRRPVDAVFDQLEGRRGDGGLEQVVDGDAAVGVDGRAPAVRTSR